MRFLRLDQELIPIRPLLQKPNLDRSGVQVAPAGLDNPSFHADSRGRSPRSTFTAQSKTTFISSIGEKLSLSGFYETAEEIKGIPPLFLYY